MKGKLSAYVKIKSSTQQLEYNIGEISQQKDRQKVREKKEEIRVQFQKDLYLNSSVSRKRQIKKEEKQPVVLFKNRMNCQIEESVSGWYH